MRLPEDQDGKTRSWVTEPANDALVYFVQLMDELLAHQSHDGLRPVSLDSYHRLRELERSWDEWQQAGIHANLQELATELLAYLSRDPIVTHAFRSHWNAVQPHLRSAKDRPTEAVEAARYLAGKLQPQYLRG